MSVPINTAPQRCVTHEFLMGYHACGFQNPQDFIFLSDDILGFLRFEVRVHKYTFLFVGTHFKTHLGFQRDGSSFGSGSSNRGEERPVGWGFQRGQRSLGGRHPMEGSALKWQEESNETGGFVAHDLVCKV